MKRMVVFILLLLLTCVWSNVCAGLYDNQSPIVVPSAKLTLCTPGTFLIGNYEFAFPKADITTNLQLEYFDMLHCYARQANLTLLPSSIITEPTYDTICAGETYTWHGNTYTKPGTYADTLSNIHGCDSIVTLHLHVLPDPPITFTVNGVSFKMMRVRAGTFMMGATADDTEAETNEHPAHQVTLTRDYFIAETMLTQELWTAVMGTTIQEEEAKGSGDKGLGYGPNYPMYCISYYECQDFVKSLSDSIGLEFRMPSEAEWEYAARGGHLSRGYKYPGSNDATEVAWNVARDPSKKLHEVKQLLPNELGLYDMAGNTWEWIYDFNRPYSGQPQIDPIGDTSSTNAFIRGGSSYYSDIYNRVSSRGIDFPKTYKRNRIAFRFVLDADHVIGEDNTTYQAYDTICAGETYTWNGNTYTTSGSYTDTLQNIYGCDSVVTLHLKVNQIQYAEEMVTVCNNYTWNGQTYTESGNYTYTTTAANGCDNITTLHLTINKTVYAEETVTACDSYTWNSETYTESGNYTYTTIAANGCDSITTLHLTINKTVYKEETITACDSYTWNGQTYTESGSYTYTTTAANGCDSITTLHLTINKTVYAEETVTACDSYTWNSETYTESGSYTYTTTAANGCDSITTLHLTINKTVYAEETVTACDSYTWNSETYTESGNYTYTTTAANGCDSITTLHLTINYSDTALFTETACDSYTWHDQIYNTSGTYYYHTLTALGCDSVEVLHLTILPPTQYLAFDTLLCHGVICEWRDMLLTTAGTYNDTIKNQLLCDSIIYTLNLTYLPNVQNFTTDTTLCYGSTYEWRDMLLTTAGTYNNTVKNQLLCDSIIYTLHLHILPEIPITHITDTMAGAEYHWHEQIYTHGGEYTVILPAITGCDSVVILNLISNPAAIDTVILYEQCAGSGEQDLEILTQGFIEQIALSYSPAAQEAGLQDTIMPFSQDEIYTISYRDIRAGIHELTAIALFHNQQVATYSFALTYLYPNTIFEQRYNDLIAVLTHDYNGGYDFTDFQWYKDNIPLQGETHSYLNLPLSLTSQYSALLTNADGLQLMSCPVTIEDKAELSVSPTLIKAGTPVVCRVDLPMQLIIYHSSGIMMEEYELPEGKTNIFLPTVPGIYLLTFTSDMHIERHVKVIVQ